MGTRLVNNTDDLQVNINGAINKTEQHHQPNNTDDLLDATHTKYLTAYMPIIVFMSITTVVGTVGNILTILFYGVKARQTSTIVFITALASLDLTVCLMACTTIIDMAVNVYFEGRYLCKLMYFFDHWTVVSSVLILWVISIDRYRKICKSAGRQFHRKSAIITVFVLIGASLVSSISTFVTYEIVKVNVTTSDGTTRLLGNYCTYTDKPDMSVVVTVVYIVDAVIIFGVFVTFFVTYGQIWHALRKHRKQCHSTRLKVRASKEVSSTERIASSMSSLNKSASADSLDSKLSLRIVPNSFNMPINDRVSFSSNRLELPQRALMQRQNPNTPVTRKTSKSERNITVMMLAVSVGFMICFTPYFIVNAIRVATMTGESEMGPFIQFLLRSPFYNSVINPIIFCVFNPQFRKYVKSVMFGCNIKQNAFSSTSG